MMSLLVLAALVSSCGSKKNKTDGASNGSSSPASSPSSVPAGSYNPGGGNNPDFAARVQNFKNQIQCQAGGRVEVTFHSNSQVDSNSITGPFQLGSSGGAPVGAYVGRSAFGDVIAVTKNSVGPNQVAYDITLAFCYYKKTHTETYYQYPYGMVPITVEVELIGPSTTFDNFLQVGQIDLGLGGYEGLGRVLSANKTLTRTNKGDDIITSFYCLEGRPLCQ